jgi:hypothetical protein
MATMYGAFKNTFYSSLRDYDDSHIHAKAAKSQSPIKYGSSLVSVSSDKLPKFSYQSKLCQRLALPKYIMK